MKTTGVLRDGGGVGVVDRGVLFLLFVRSEPLLGRDGCSHPSCSRYFRTETGSSRAAWWAPSSLACMGYRTCFLG